MRLISAVYSEAFWHLMARRCLAVIQKNHNGFIRAASQQVNKHFCQPASTALCSCICFFQTPFYLCSVVVVWLDAVQNNQTQWLRPKISRAAYLDSSFLCCLFRHSSTRLPNNRHIYEYREFDPA